MAPDYENWTLKALRREVETVAYRAAQLGNEGLVTIACDYNGKLNALEEFLVESMKQLEADEGRHIGPVERKPEFYPINWEEKKR